MNNNFTVCITGAGSGIGRAMALKFSEHNANIVLSDINTETLGETFAMLPNSDNALVIAGNAAKDTDVEHLVTSTLEKFGQIDSFLANAGMAGLQAPINEFTTEQFQEVLNVNLISTFLAVKYAGSPMIKAGKGSIVLTASVAGINANGASAIYSASKAGVISLAKTAAQEFTGSGVRVNAICPGLIETEMTKFIFDNAKKHDQEPQLGLFNPCQRPGIPDDIANAAYFLASEQSSYINGQSITVDGGLSSSLPFIPGKIVKRKA
jgi:NAD(P)-dependent dehydrogenase (short-subunit alcohol dehydrogenase family)